MSYLQLGNISAVLTKIKAPALLDPFLRIQNAVNHLDDKNFPNGLDGSVIAVRTLPPSALTVREWPIVIASSMTPYSTTSTTDVDIGGYFAWDPGKFPNGSWYLEAAIAATSGGICTVVLKGAAVVGSVQTSSTALTRVRSEALTMPSTAQNLWAAVKTNNTSYAAKVASVSLIFVP